MRALAYRIMLTCINIFFPPLAVMMLTGMGWDTMMNCCLFLLAVIPSHVHGFYISCTYFHRRKKVKKGRYPGGPKSFIESTNVINGGASPEQVDMLWRKENGLERKSSGRAGHGSMRRNNSYRPDNVQRQPSNRPQMAQSQSSNQMRRRNSDRPWPGVLVQRPNNNMVGRVGTNDSQRPMQRPMPHRYASRMQEHMSRDASGLVGDYSLGGPQGVQPTSGSPRW